MNATGIVWAFWAFWAFCVLVLCLASLGCDLQQPPRAENLPGSHPIMTLPNGNFLYVVCVDGDRIYASASGIAVAAGRCPR